MIRLFGDVLPFFGFRTLDRSELIRRGMDHLLTPSPTNRYELLEVEWLGRGFTIAGRAVTSEK